MGNKNKHSLKAVVRKLKRAQESGKVSFMLPVSGVFGAMMADYRILIGGILPETNPDMARDLKPWISFEFDLLLLPLGVLYGLSMLWNWLTTRSA